MICKKIKATKETYFNPFIEGLYHTEIDEIHHNGTITTKNRCMAVTFVPKMMANFMRIVNARVGIAA